VFCCAASVTSGYVATSPLPLAPGIFGSSSSNGNLEQQQQQSQQQQQQQQQSGQLSSSLSTALSLSSHEQALRNTPQAFSHFTFEFTKVRAICIRSWNAASNVLYVHTLSSALQDVCGQPSAS
jgi:type II secretory pathway pseudopilin PulG